jgi:hypothetical protein
MASITVSIMADTTEATMEIINCHRGGPGEAGGVGYDSNSTKCYASDLSEFFGAESQGDGLVL